MNVFNKFVIPLIFLLAAGITTVNAESTYQFVGISTSTHEGDAGVRNFTLSCQKDYPGSRFCTSEEYLNTVKFPAQSKTGEAWIRPVFSTIVSPGAASVLDISGVASGASDWLTCSAWNDASASYTGLSVKENGSFAASPCLKAIPVTCCAPVE